MVIKPFGGILRFGKVHFCKLFESSDKKYPTKLTFEFDELYNSIQSGSVPLGKTKVELFALEASFKNTCEYKFRGAMIKKNKNIFIGCDEM